MLQRRSKRFSQTAPSTNLCIKKQFSGNTRENITQLRTQYKEITATVTATPTTARTAAAATMAAAATTAAATTATATT